MKNRPRTSSGGIDVTAKWNDMTPFERLQLIVNNSELFWDLRLVTRSELLTVMSMSESAKEYIVDREDHPIFTSIDLKEAVNTQNHRDKIEAALNAVFLNHSASESFHLAV